MYKLLNAVIFLICAGILLQTFYSCAWQSPSSPNPLDPSKPPERAGQRDDVSKLWYDLIEDDPALQKKFQAAEGEAAAEMERSVGKGQKDYQDAFDRAKQRILREKYGIAWLTTREMSPGAYFD
jgi:hypothetical protein